MANWLVTIVCGFTLRRQSAMCVGHVGSTAVALFQLVTRDLETAEYFLGVCQNILQLFYHTDRVGYKDSRRQVVCIIANSYIP